MCRDADHYKHEQSADFCIMSTTMTIALHHN